MRIFWSTRKFVFSPMARSRIFDRPPDDALHSRIEARCRQKNIHDYPTGSESFAFDRRFVLGSRARPLARAERGDDLDGAARLQRGSFARTGSKRAGVSHPSRSAPCGGAAGRLQRGLRLFAAGARASAARHSRAWRIRREPSDHAVAPIGTGRHRLCPRSGGTISTLFLGRFHGKSLSELPGPCRHISGACRQHKYDGRALCNRSARLCFSSRWRVAEVYAFS